MNPDSDSSLDALFAQARARRPDTGRAEYGFETRLLARLRTERDPSSIWAMVSWRLAPLFAALVIGLTIWQSELVSETNDAETLAQLDNPAASDLWDNAN